MMGMQQGSGGQIMRNMMVQPGGQYEQNAYGMPPTGAPMQRAPGDPYVMQQSQSGVCHCTYFKTHFQGDSQRTYLRFMGSLRREAERKRMK